MRRQLLERRQVGLRRLDKNHLALGRKRASLGARAAVDSQLALRHGVGPEAIDQLIDVGRQEILDLQVNLRPRLLAHRVDLLVPAQRQSIEVRRGFVPLRVVG